MTVEEARDILIQHNKWRRDNSVPNSETMVNPTELGIAIDIAIDVLMEHIDKYSLNEESYASYSAQLSLPF